MKLTSHAASMDLMVQFPGDGVVPRERFGPRSQLFMRTATEQGAETLMTHWQVMQDLQHVNQDRDGYREQHNRLERVDHLDQRD